MCQTLLKLFVGKESQRFPKQYLLLPVILDATTGHGEIKLVLFSNLLPCWINFKVPEGIKQAPDGGSHQQSYRAVDPVSSNSHQHGKTLMGAIVA